MFVYFLFIHHIANVIFLLKDKSQTAELWEKLNFGNKDQNVKFRKLMGIKVGGTNKCEII